ncbi:hypothetical protein MBLNU457_6435t2 [Dothideomycetes sp. NU457]
MIAIIVVFATLLPLVLCKTVYYNWNVTYTHAAPDGFLRRVIGINNQWPCPQLDVDLGDEVVVNLYNALPDQSVSLHWHGLHQNGTNEMDGAVGFVQCPVPPGHRFTYKWKADQPGTYWYHSHDTGQYPDGLWGPLIIHDPNPPFEFDEEITVTLTDWFHTEMPQLMSIYESHAGEAEDGSPNPDVALINTGVNVSIPVKPGKTYFVHIICPSNYIGHAWLFDGHPQTTVEIDGVYVVPQPVNNGENQFPMTRLAPGQRQGVLIQTKNDTSRNYAVFDTMDVNMLFINKGIIPPPSNYNPNATAWLVYNDSAPLPDPPVFYSLGNADFYDDVNYVPLDKQPLLEPVDHRIILNMDAANISGISRFVMNNISYIGAKVPSLYTGLSVPDNLVSDPIVYGDVNPFIFAHNSIVEVVINNLNTNLHPFHLHGHQFQILQRTDPKTGVWPGYTNTSSTPARRDTVMLQDEAYAVIRFRADNPGVWAFHCHIETHVVSGFSATFVEAPEVFASGKHRVLIPRDHVDVCKAVPMEFRGNAAGNTWDALNLTGELDSVLEAPKE